VMTDTITEYVYGDGQPDGATVREILTNAYGEDWERELSDVIDTAERSEMHYTQRAGESFRNYRHDYYPVIVLRNTKGRDVHGYEDPIDVANYRVLQDNWSDYEGLTNGPYSGSSHIALDLDKLAPSDLVETLEALARYPLLSNDEHSVVENEFITEHWESYGRDDTLDAVARAIGADNRSDLTDYATELVEQLTFSGALSYGCGDGWPTFIDVSAVDFGTDAVAAWIRARLGLVVSVRTNSGYGPSFTAYLNKRNLIGA
jgi:hypothetical protein